jgi:hypothetical protein
MVQFTSFTPIHTFSSICEHTCKNLLGGNEGGKSKATKSTHTLTHLHTQTSLRWTFRFFSFLSHFLNWRWLLWAKDGWMNGRQQRSTFGHFWSPSLSRNRSRRNFFFFLVGINIPGSTWGLCMRGPRNGDRGEREYLKNELDDLHFQKSWKTVFRFDGNCLLAEK